MGLSGLYRMSHRVLHVVLICIATWGIGSTAIARDAAEFERETLLAQSSDVTNRSNSSRSSLTPSQAAEQIQNLQRRLSELGYYEGSIDGIYGPNTQGALAEFQQSEGLAGTGVMDPLTRERLISSTAPRSSDTAESGESALTLSSLASSDEVAAETTSDIAQNGTAPTPEGDGTDASSPDEEASDGESEAASEGETASPDSEAGDDDVSSSPSPEQQQDRGLFRLALIGLAIVVFGGLGGTALLLARRSSASSEALEEEADAMNGTPPRDISPVSPTYTETTRNGSSQLASASSVSGIKRQTTLSATSTSSTPRLAKVNIIDELIQDLDNPNPGIRRKAIWELGQRGNSTAVQPLVGLIVNADSHEQCLILAALAEIGSQTLKPMNRALVLSLQSENPEVRKNAIRDLTRIYDLMGHVGRALGQAATDDDPDVRQTAEWALNQLNRMRLTPKESAGLLQESKTSVEPFSENQAKARESLPESTTAPLQPYIEEDLEELSIESLPGDEASSRTM